MITFQEIGGAGKLICNNCRHEQDIVSFLHGSEWCASGFQCQKCGKISVQESDKKWSKTYDCGGEYSRDEKLFCPICKSKNLSYRMSFIT
jgi:hypothetical protein